jgi:hypothetical protein
MSDPHTGAPRPEDVTVARWQDNNPPWMVMGVLPVISTDASGEAVEEIEIKVHYRETGVVLGATGFTVTMALAMIDYLISERY